MGAKLHSQQFGIGIQPEPARLQDLTESQQHSLSQNNFRLFFLSNVLCHDIQQILLRRRPGICTYLDGLVGNRPYLVG